MSPATSTLCKEIFRQGGQIVRRSLRAQQGLLSDHAIVGDAVNWLIVALQGPSLVVRSPRADVAE